MQISAYVDALLASLLPTGAVAALAYAQAIYTLPVSLFGMSVSAAELPLMVENAVASVPGVSCAKVNIVWDPPWDPSRMSDEARLVLNMW